MPEALRRVRAADAVSERMSMTGQPLEPVRPHLAAAQRDGDISAEQVDIIERELAKVSGPGFGPAVASRRNDVESASAHD